MAVSLPRETRAELRRLCIAGGNLAQGDFRLQKLIPALREAGARAPVFARLADGLEKASSGRGEAAPHLMETGALACAIMRTQAVNGKEGELIPLSGEGGEALARILEESRTSSRVLRELLQMMNGSGDNSAWNEAVKNGRLIDPRLIDGLCRMVGHSYEGFNEPATKALLALGMPAAARLARLFNPSGKKAAEETRRLNAIGRIMGEAGKDLYLRAWEEGSPAVRAASLEHLALFPEFSDLLLNAAKDKKKDVREAALKALSRIPGPESLAILAKALNSQDYAAAVSGIASSGREDLWEALLAAADNNFAELCKFCESGKDGKENGKPVTEASASRFFTMLGGIKNSPLKTPAMFNIAVLALRLALALPRQLYLKDLLPAFSEVGTHLQGHSFIAMAAYTLASFNTGEALAELEAHLYEPGVYSGYLAAIFPLLISKRSPAVFYDRLRPFFARPPKNPEQPEEPCATLLRKFGELLDFPPPYGASGNHTPDLDPRWNELFISHKYIWMVAVTARPGMKDAERFLTDVLAKTDIKQIFGYYWSWPLSPVFGLLSMGARDFLPDLAGRIEREYLMEFFFGDNWKGGRSGLPNIEHNVRILSLFPNEARPMLARVENAVKEKSPEKLYIIEDLKRRFEESVG